MGAGLAGSECAWQLAQKGYSVELFEMRGVLPSPAHKSSHFAELVCSNSFGSFSEGSAPQQLKWEAQHLDSLILKTALKHSVPAGQALAIEREGFSKEITELLQNHPQIQVHRKPITSLEEVPRPAVIATGPLTESRLAESLQSHFGQDFLFFFDAIAPIIDADSIDTSIAWRADRYDKGSPDYLNCPLNREEYESFIDEVLKARKIEPKDFEKTPFFEGCMPIEVMAERGIETLRFGPMKPVGLKDPRTGEEPWAVVQLRMENKEGTAYNMVGFQTRMAYGEQKRIFQKIPGLQRAEFLKLGSMHRNLYIHSPTQLAKDLSSKKDPWLFFAGQITGVEGYFESASMGLLVAQFLHQKNQGGFNPPPRESLMGGLLEAITAPERGTHFQPTNVNFGIFPTVNLEILLQEGWDKKSAVRLIKNKQEKKNYQIQRARKTFSQWKDSL